MQTKEEFEQGYAERSGVTVEWLHAHDQQAVPCDCGEPGCLGWQMVSTTGAIIHWSQVGKLKADSDLSYYF